MRERTMSTRRLSWALFALLMLTTGMGGSVRAADGEAVGRIRSFYDALLSTMRNGPSLGAQGRYRQLKPIIARTFDLPYMARLAVGPSWASSSAAEQREVMEVFWRYITATYSERFDHFSGQEFQVLGQVASGPNRIIDTRIIRADGSTVVIKYLMHRAEDDWRIADIYLGGTVSELATRRAEFASVIRQQGLDGLIARLDLKAQEFTGGAAR